MRSIIISFGIFLVGNLSVIKLSPLFLPIVPYMLQVITYVCSGFVLGGRMTDMHQNHTPGWLITGGCMLLLIILPLFGAGYAITAFLIKSHVEIFPAFLLGLCIRSLAGRNVTQKSE